MKKPVGIEDFQEIRMLSNLAFSPDGKHAAFTVSQGDQEEGYSSGIWLYTRETGSLVQLTTAKGERSFCWEDDFHLLFPAARDEKTKKLREKGEQLTDYYRIDIRCGEAGKAFSLPIRATGLRRAGAGRFAVTGVYDLSRPGPLPVEQEERERVLSERKRERDYEVIDELPWFFNGNGFVNKLRQRVYLYDARADQLSPVSNPTFQTLGIAVSECGRYLAYYGDDYTDVYSRRHSIWVYDSETGENRELLSREFSVSQIAFYQGKLLFAGTDQKKWGAKENPCFYTLPLQGGERPTLFHPFDRTIGKPGGSDCRYGGGTTLKVVGGAVYFTSADGGFTKLYRMDETGIEAVVSEELVIDFFDIAGEELLFAAFEGVRPQELYRKKLPDGAVRRVSNFNEAYYESHEIIEPERLSFLDPEGFRIEGWVLKPAGYTEGTRYPAILDIHGGPKVSFGETYFHQFQYLASQGYFVLYCNPRGSDAYGNEFARLDQNQDWFDYENLMQFVDICLERYPDIDSSRLGVEGGSYGGFMTNLIIGKTDRFAAACSQRSISNWIGFVGHADIGYINHYQRGVIDLWSDESVRELWERSPVRFADQAVTPTLFIHSDEDYRCNVVEGYQMYTALKLRGTETRMVLFHGENHELSRSGKPVHRVRRLREITDWFDRFLK